MHHIYRYLANKDFSKFCSKSFKLKHKLSCLYRKFCKKGSEFCLLWVKISHVNTKLKGLWRWLLSHHTTLLTMALNKDTAKLKLANILQNLKRMKKPLWKNPNLSSWVCTCPCNWLGLLFFRKIAKKKKKMRTSK